MVEFGRIIQKNNKRPAIQVHSSGAAAEDIWDEVHIPTIKVEAFWAATANKRANSSNIRIHESKWVRVEQVKSRGPIKGKRDSIIDLIAEHPKERIQKVADRCTSDLTLEIEIQRPTIAIAREIQHGNIAFLANVKTRGGKIDVSWTIDEFLQRWERSTFIEDRSVEEIDLVQLK